MLRVSRGAGVLNKSRSQEIPTQQNAELSPGTLAASTQILTVPV